MPAGYAPLPNPRSEPEAEREMEEAFDSDHGDDEHHTESTPLTQGYIPTERPEPTALTIPGAYDFERDYDYPPPGSPPSPTAFALPNDIGNTNGQLPSAPVRPQSNRPSFFRRAVGALLPQHYARIPSGPAVTRPRGGGIENDGVFANVMAKPGRSVAVRDRNGEVYMVPEEVQNEMPPSYTEAQADAVPPYWETTVHAPLGLGPGDMIVDDLPTGSVVFFIATIFVSYFFQFVGFILTYLLHTSHAAKYGSRAGLGLTLIQYGSASRAQTGEDAEFGQDVLFWNATAGTPMLVPNPEPTFLPNGTYVDLTPELGFTSRDWMSLLLMTLGWFLLLSSLIGFYRVKRWEMSIRTSDVSPLSPDQMRRDAEVRRNIERVFGLLDYGDSGPDDNGERRAEPVSEAEERLQRDLRAAGLL
ncbi:hypothetical protein AcV5_008591 [Taiwanofungus camphoratus]|nr:hypothetical protein AcV5_008591 [Antrodia cinnamomea]